MSMISVDPGSTLTGSTQETALPPKDTLEDPLIEELSVQIRLAVEQLAAGDFHSRWDAAKRFSQDFSEWGDRTIPVLIQQIQIQKDPDVQWFLIRILSQFEHPMTVTALAELLTTTDSADLQQSASRALSDMGAIAIDTLKDFLTAQSAHSTHEPTTEQANIRKLAARTLAHIRRGAVIEPLLSITDDPDVELRAITLEALGSFHDSRITPVLIKALNDQPSICKEAIRALGRRRDLLPTTDLVTPLQQCLRSPNETIARESAIALGRLGSQDAIETLGEGLNEPLPTGVKSTIASSLGWLNQSAAIAYLVASFQRSEPFTTAPLKEAIARALGQTQDESLKQQAARPLIDWLTDEGVNSGGEKSVIATPHGITLAQSILSALTRLGVSGALAGIVPVLAHSDSRLRLHALNALKQIDPRAAQQQVQQYLAQPEVSDLVKHSIKETLKAW